MDITPSLLQLSRGLPLDEQATAGLFSGVLAGELTPAQIGAVLGMLAVRGPTTDELVGAARVMRAHAERVPRPALPRIILDTCGTGGAPKTFNVSTIAALAVAAAAPGRVGVAKHGNRSRTGRGSAEILGAMGVNVDATPRVQSRCLERAGVCFCFAIHHHPAARHAGPARRELGFQTIFNLLGPLTNPAGAEHQLLGVYDRRFARPVAEALARLGSVRAMVVHSRDGLDEISIAAPTDVWELRDGRIREWTLEPTELGVKRSPLESVTASDLAHATSMARSILDGSPSPAAEMVALNAAAALAVTDVVGSLSEGLKLSREALASGRAREVLTRLAELSLMPA
ncbi:MAG: anthranilate phosphoribosyltransferase [Phycisphaerales bacterium]